MTTRRRLFILGAVLLAAVAGAGSIKVWSTGEYITSTDINANFAHIHNQMVGGHGARLVNADVSSAAALSHAKLATPALVPKSWVVIATCAGATDGGSGGTCTLADSSNITSVTAGTTGNYTVTFPARGSANYGVLVNSHTSLGSCGPTTRSTTTVGVYCWNSSNAAADSIFTLMILDTEN
jgi:hypothetical protein